MIRILTGDCRDVLATLPDASVQCCVTSPPYYGLREYGTATWEGGDLSCDHVVGELRTGLGLAKLGERYRGGGHKQAELGKVYAKGECPKCGALRIDKQIGLEPTPAEYVEQMVAVFRELWRVLRDDGTVWLNLGDSYNAARDGGHPGGSKQWKPDQTKYHGRSGANVPGLKPKDLIGIPWRVAFALQDDGWWLRQDNIWAKRNCMPESVLDRTTRAHEYLFMLTKSGTATFWTHRDLPGARTMPAPDYRWLHRATGEQCPTDPGDDKTWRRINLWRGKDYFYDAVAIEEEGDIPAGTRAAKGSNVRSETKGVNGRPPEYFEYTGKRNKRSVWWVATQPFPEAHFATFPPDLIEPCIKAGTSEHGCCAKCGAPWVRQVERSKDLSDREARGKALTSPRHDGNPWNENDGRGFLPVETTTTGWQPSCACNAAVAPCAVLDPFGGAGTTGLVADRLGRDAILIELNPDYAAMAERRIHGDAPLFADVAAQ